MDADARRLLDALAERMLPEEEVRRLFLRETAAREWEAGGFGAVEADRGRFFRWMAGLAWSTFENAPALGRDPTTLPWPEVPEGMRVEAEVRAASALARSEEAGWVELDPRVRRYALTEAGRVARAGEVRRVE